MTQEQALYNMALAVLVKEAQSMRSTGTFEQDYPQGMGYPATGPRPFSALRGDVRASFKPSAGPAGPQRGGELIGDVGASFGIPETPGGRVPGVAESGMMAERRRAGSAPTSIPGRFTTPPVTPGGYFDVLDRAYPEITPASELARQARQVRTPAGPASMDEITARNLAMMSFDPYASY